MIPSTLREMRDHAFSDCGSLKLARVRKGCAVDIKGLVRDSVEVRYE